MAEHTLFPAKIVTPEGTAFDGEVQQVEVTSSAGGLGILARRAPVVADLKMGHIRAQLADGSWQVWASAEGFAQASDSTATIVVEEAVALGDIVASEATALATEGRERLAAAGDDAAEAKSAGRAVAWGEHLLTIQRTETFNKH
jgi:F-type H+-transporting ATPase subunit epsilon